MANPFLEVTTLHRDGDGRFRGTITEDWVLRPLPQGGVVTAIALRSMQAELGHPEQRLRTLHTSFVGQVAAGTVEVDVEVLRRGRSMSHARAEVRNEGAARGHLTTAIFGAERRGFRFTDLEPPVERTPPAECPSFRDPPPPGIEPFPPMTFWDRLVEGRAVSGHAPWEEYVPDRAEHVKWVRLDDPPVLDGGALDALALPVLVDTMPGAVAEKLGPGQRDWFAPSVDLTLHLLEGVALAVAAGPQHRPPRRRGLRLGRHGAVGLRRRRSGNAATRGLRHAGLPLHLPAGVRAGAGPGRQGTVGSVARPAARRSSVTSSSAMRPPR